MWKEKLIFHLCKEPDKHQINHLAPSGFRISNAKHKITDPDNISDKQQAAAIKKHRQKEQSINRDYEKISVN